MTQVQHVPGVEHAYPLADRAKRPILAAGVGVVSPEADKVLHTVRIVVCPGVVGWTTVDSRIDRP